MNNQLFINGVETIQVAPKFSNEYGEEIVQTTTSEQVMLKMDCVKAVVVRKTEVLKGTRGSNPLASALKTKGTVRFLLFSIPSTGQLVYNIYCLSCIGIADVVYLIRFYNLYESNLVRDSYPHPQK